MYFKISSITTLSMRNQKPNVIKCFGSSNHYLFVYPSQSIDGNGHNGKKRVIILHNTSVIKQKGESQNGGKRKTKHTKFPENRTFLTS